MYTPAQQQQLLADTQTWLQRGTRPATLTTQDMAQLVGLLHYHEWRYYVINDPVITDTEYDTLFTQLRAWEAAHPEWIMPASPTQRVGSDLTTTLANVQHLTPMLSLENSYNEEDLLAFDKQVKKLCDLSDEAAVSYCVEPKLDGGSIALVYENDQLVRAATRGNGQIGEDITANIRTLRSVPLQANFSSIGMHTVEIRGEALIRKDNFVKINEQRELNDEVLFANPRNAATGALRTKDPAETGRRGIEAFAYQLGYAIDEQQKNVLKNTGTHYESIHLLAARGFKVPLDVTKLCHNIQEVIAHCLYWQAQRETYPYEIDGMVVKVNSLKYQELCGYTTHHPRWAIAFKFKAKQATSTLQHVDFQVGKIGSITPVAKITPVPLAGVTVSSISLHNEDFIKARDIRIGDKVLVERAGDVIPYIVKVLPEWRTGAEVPIQFPTHCPVCTATLVKEADEAAWRCVNYACKAQVLQRIIHHVSKDAMDIDGFGKANVERFYELGWLQTPADVYTLDYEKIAQLEGFGEKSATNLQKAIEKAKKNPLHRLLHSLSIHHVGKKAAKLLAAHLTHIKELETWQLEQFLAIKEVGPVVAQNVMDFFAQPANRAWLAAMERAGVNMQPTDEDRLAAPQEGLPLSGKTILFTGTLQKMGRKEAELRAQQAGARVMSAVSSQLQILVAGEEAGSKLTKAQKLGTVTIWDEDTFLTTIASVMNE